MTLNDTAKEDFKRRLGDMSDEDIQLGLDTGQIDSPWKRSLAEQELKRRQGASDLERLSTSLRHTRYGLGIALATLVVAVLALILK